MLILCILGLLRCNISVLFYQQLNHHHVTVNNSTFILSVILNYFSKIEQKNPDREKIKFLFFFALQVSYPSKQEVSLVCIAVGA